MNAPKNKIAYVLVLLTLAGCATLPEGPTVMVLPSQYKPFEVFQDEELTCRNWAASRIGLTAEETPQQTTANSAVLGTLLGAGIGAMFGAASGDPGVGAAFGAGTGLLAGTAIGADAAQNRGWDAQRRYDSAYVQCMYSYGNQVPSSGTQRRLSNVPPPPPPPSLEDRY